MDQCTPPIAQAKLWNKSELDMAVDPPYYKTQSKLMFLEHYQEEIHSNPELYSEYIDSNNRKLLITLTPMQNAS